MRTAQTTLADVAVGRVIVGGVPGTASQHSQARDVLVARSAMPHGLLVDLARIGGPLPVLESHFYSVVAAGDTVVEIEAGPTPAQMHGDELFLRLEWAVAFIDLYARQAAGPATPELNKCRGVLEAVKRSEGCRAVFEVESFVDALKRLCKRHGVSLRAGVNPECILLDDLALNAEAVRDIEDIRTGADHA